MNDEAKAIEKELIQMSWAMRGGITLNEAYALSPYQREIIANMYKTNLETTNATGLPFF
jgi:hypothetical protein